MALSKADKAEIVAELLAALGGATPAATAAPISTRTRKAAKPPKSDGDPTATFKVRPGTRDGYSEILFSGKPSTAIRANLKKHGFRWSGQNGVWYGLTVNLPAGVR